MGPCEEGQNNISSIWTNCFYKQNYWYNIYIQCKGSDQSCGEGQNNISSIWTELLL